MCLISDCQRRSRCKARDALLGCPPSLLVEPSKGGKGESVVAEKLGSIEIKNPGEIVLCYVIGAIVPRDPPSSPSPSVLSLFRLCRGKTDLEHSLSPFSLRLSFSLSLSLSLFLTAFIRAFIVIQGTGSSIVALFRSTIRTLQSNHRCDVQWE